MFSTDPKVDPNVVTVSKVNLRQWLASEDFTALINAQVKVGLDSKLTVVTMGPPSGVSSIPHSFSSGFANTIVSTQQWARTLLVKNSSVSSQIIPVPLLRDPHTSRRRLAAGIPPREGIPF